MLQGRRQRWTRFAGLAALIVALAATFMSPANAQTPGLTVQITGMTGEQWPETQAVLSVLGSDGRPLPNLTAENFRAALNDSDVPVTAVAQGVNSSQPIDVVLVLDVSGSMAGDALDQAKTAAHSFLDQLGPEDRVAIVTFGTAVTTALPFTADRAAARAAIDGLSAEGITALYEATAEGVRVASGGQNTRRAIVLLSDGGVGILSGAVTREEAIATAETGGVPVFAIGLGIEIDRAYLRELADKTGGQFAETPSPEGLAALYQEFGALLRGQYILTLDASALEIKRSQPATLRVEVTQGDLSGNDERAVCAQNVCIAIGGLEDGERVDGERTIEAQVVATEPVTSVALLVDGQTISTLDAPPYAFTIDARSLSDGDHTLVAEAATLTDSFRSAEIGVRIGAAASAGGGLTSGLLPVAAIAVIAVAAVLAVLFVLRRRRGRGPQMAPTSPEPPAPTGIELRPGERASRRIRTDGQLPQRPQAAPQRLLGSLRVTGADLPERTFPIGGAPISIGTGYRCLIGLPEAGFEEIATEHVRVWIRDDHLVVHELRRLTAFGPTGGRWEFLTAGDTFTIGAHTFTFELIGETSPAKTVETQAVTMDRAPGAPPPGLEPARAEQSAAPPAPAEQPPGPIAPVQPPAAPSPVAIPIASEPASPAPPAREAPDTSLAPTQEPAPDVPNILRDRPAAPPPPASSAPNEIPNILRDRPADAASPPATALPSQPVSPAPGDIPQILRERPPADAEETSAPASGDPQASEAPPEQRKDESAA